MSPSRPFPKFVVCFSAGIESATFGLIGVSLIVNEKSEAALLGCIPFDKRYAR